MMIAWVPVCKEEGLWASARRGVTRLVYWQVGTGSRNFWDAVEEFRIADIASVRCARDYVGVYSSSRLLTLGFLSVGLGFERGTAGA